MDGGEARGLAGYAGEQGIGGRGQLANRSGRGKKNGICGGGIDVRIGGIPNGLVADAVQEINLVISGNDGFTTNDQTLER